jgi:TPR repeat protein
MTPAKAPAAPDPTQPAAAPQTDAPEATASTEPPIWTTESERKPARKVAKATPAARHDAPIAANAAAMRNDGYTALQQRRYREALTLLQQATMMGDADAPMYIGQIFENGIGVARDVGQASYWYGIAINRGNGAALTAFNRMRVNPY